jgi:hypothetical protein
LVAKQLRLLRELLPGAVRVAVLVNPADAARAQSISQNVEAAARVLGLQIAVLNASTAGEIDAVFASLARERADALLIGADPFFNSRRVQLATLAARHAIPSASGGRDGTEARLLVSYGTSVADTCIVATPPASPLLPQDRPTARNARYCCTSSRYPPSALPLAAALHALGRRHRTLANQRSTTL